MQTLPNGEPRLVILDCGIVYSSKTEQEHKDVVDICFAFMKHDGRHAAELMIAKAKQHNTVRHEEEFKDAIQDMVDESETQSYFEHISDYVNRICMLARTHVVRLDPGYFKIAMALKVSEGISLQLDKDLDLVSKCIPIIAKTRALRELGIKKFPAPEEYDNVTVFRSEKKNQTSTK